mmetsp:Transcript_28463/g.81500  ORF Transcript_28463/g.81500 Transcript_28463/m.81500 type:complete len:207 (-) Transcript_28463:86-706(-)
MARGMPAWRLRTPRPLFWAALLLAARGRPQGRGFAYLAPCPVSALGTPPAYTSGRGQRSTSKPLCGASRAAASRPWLEARRALEGADSELGLGLAGVAASCLMLWSEYTLKNTGRGLPEGPFGLLGGLEGVSYLVVLGIAAWSTYTKVTTGSGLPAGKFGLLGAAEGLSFLAVAGGLVVLAFQISERGYLDFSPFPLRIDFKGKGE